MATSPASADRSPPWEFCSTRWPTSFSSRPRSSLSDTQLNPSLVPAWIAVVVIGREFLVSGLRSIAASEGFTIEARDLGKFKMVVQIVSVVAVILDHRWKEWPIYSHYIFPIHWIAYLAIWFMVCVSLVSAIDYFVAFWSKIDRRVVKRRRRAFILSRRQKPVPPPADRDVAAST